MFNILIFGMNDNPGGVESFLMNYARNFDKTKIHMDFLCNTKAVSYTHLFEQYETFVEINELILLKIIEAYRLNNGTGRLIFPSTRLVYKGRDGLLKEDAEKEFKTIYAINKYSCENYLWMYNNMYGIPYTVFRICLPYGTLVPEASSYGTAEFFMKKATAGENITLYGDGTVSYTHLDVYKRQV